MISNILQRGRSRGWVGGGGRLPQKEGIAPPLFESELSYTNLGIHCVVYTMHY